MMSDQIRSDPPTPPVAPSFVLPPRGVSRTTLLLSVLLTAAVTAAVVLGVIALRGGAGQTAPGPSDPSTTPTLVKDGDVYVQKATVKPEGTTGHVIYPMPYAVPPHLTLTSGKRKYTIVKQDELGFTWKAADLAEDFVDDVRKVPFNVPDGRGQLVDQVVGKKKRDHIEYESFVWEARGLRLGAAEAAANTKTLFEQEGTFRAVPGEQGDVNFPFPYALPPNVELSGDGLSQIVIPEIKATGFKWKHRQQNGVSYEMKWKAKGIKATTLPK
jgi:hypothetical protein